MTRVLSALVATAAVVGAQRQGEVKGLRGQDTAAGLTGCTSDDTSFSVLLLVEQWPGSIGVNAPGFTLHGLWPSRTGANVANYPCFCTNQTFDPTAVASIRTELDQFWPSSQQDNVEFWTHEYTKHGTCAESISELDSELNFMSGALNLRKQQNSLKLLSNAGLTPSVTRDYSVQAFSNAFPHEVILHCNSSNYLIEVASCFDKNLNAIDCDAQAYGGTTCKDSIVFPPVGSSSGPSPSSAPSPSADACIPDHHGPPCSGDSDCVHYANCLRCAKSGYCTEEPKEDDRRE